AAAIRWNRVHTALTLVAQQLVERGLAARLRVDALDDDGTVERGPRLAVGQRLAGQAAGDDDRVGRHLADEDLAGRAVDDLGRLADEHTHRDHRAFAHHHALDDLGTRANEAIVLDDGGAGLHRLEHATDTHAAAQMHVLANLRARADGDPGVDHRAF